MGRVRGTCPVQDLARGLWVGQKRTTAIDTTWYCLCKIISKLLSCSRASLRCCRCCSLLLLLYGILCDSSTTSNLAVVVLNDLLNVHLVVYPLGDMLEPQIVFHCQAEQLPLIMAGFLQTHCNDCFLSKNSFFEWSPCSQLHATHCTCGNGGNRGWQRTYRSARMRANCKK